MNILFIVSKRRDWPFDIRGVKIVPARLYLTDPAYADCTDTKVFNLCHSYRYQSRGYYVSMLAEARGHHPLPDVKAIEDVQSDTLIQSMAEGLDELIQSALSNVDAGSVDLSICFGRNANPHFTQLSEHLFNLLRVPLLHVRFERDQGHWQLSSVRSLHLGEIAPERLETVAQAAADCVNGHRLRTREPAAQRPTLAILRSPDCQEKPSNPAAIQKFQEAAEALGMRSELITHADADRVTQFDALFIRDTTNVHHYTYQMARQAAVAGMVVLDDCDSILKCSNKVFMNELLTRHHIPTPKTMLVHRDNIEHVIPALGLPCILKLPDGAFSLGVEKVRTEQELLEKAQQFFAKSELVLAQEYLPTEFDWRIGILDRRPLFVCKYHMVPGHWQIIKHEQDQPACEGMSEALDISAAPSEVIDIALRAANLIGDGFYGVDLKQRGHQCYIIEINDNPNVDAGNEDGVLKDALYREVMSVFRKRIEERKGIVA
jgi:glutathione synthase/RimK-type ligase-like ATP-grasp enzyme